MSLNLRVFASPTITRYMARLFLMRTVAVLAALVVVLMALDLLGETGEILAHPGNGDAALWHYVALRAPQIIVQFLPFSVLLATLITFASLNQNSEIIAMKAASVSAHQILAPLILASLLVAGVSFAFNDRVVSRATATLNAWQAADYGPIPDRRGVESNVWLRDEDDLLHVNAVTGRGAAMRLSGVTLYDRTGGTLGFIVRGAIGRAVPGGWRLDRVTRFDVARGTLERLPSWLLARAITPDRFALANVAADERSFGSLRAAIAELDAAGRPTGALEAGLWHKLSGPLSALLMPLLGAVAAFGLARSGRLFVRLVIGMALGFAYFVADNFGVAMGNLGAYPPLLAAWGPFLLFLLIGEAVLIRTEE